MTLRHGPKISAEEHSRRVVALITGQPENPTPEQERAHQRAEFRVMVDYRLGTLFPDDRFDRLCEARERVMARIAMMDATKTGRAMFRWPGLLERFLIRTTVKQLSTVLDEQELKDLIGDIPP